MDADLRMAVEWQCLRLINAFAYHIDHHNYDKVADLFAEDGVFHRDGQALKGRTAIVDALGKRPLDVIVRHVTTGHHFTEVGTTHAVVHSVNRSYFGMSDGTAPVDWKPEQMSLLDFRDTFRLTSAGWRIVERQTDLVFLSDSIRPIFGLPARQPA